MIGQSLRQWLSPASRTRKCAQRKARNRGEAAKRHRPYTRPAIFQRNKGKKWRERQEARKAKLVRNHPLGTMLEANG